MPIEIIVLYAIIYVFFARRFTFRIMKYWRYVPDYGEPTRYKLEGAAALSFFLSLAWPVVLLFRGLGWLLEAPSDEQWRAALMSEPRSERKQRRLEVAQERIKELETELGIQ